MKSRRIKSDTKYLYCRKCQQEKPEIRFYSAVDEYLDTNGYLSVCKECCGEIYKAALSTELDMKKAIYKTCKILNIAYVDDAVDSTVLHLDTKAIEMDSAFGVYKAKLGNYFRVVKDVPQTFEPVTGVKFNETDAQQIKELQGQDFSEYLKNTWGSGLSIDDYNFLENQLNEWKSKHKCDTTSELVLMQEICQFQLSLRKAREQGLDTKTLVKGLQDIIKTANLSPAQANMTGANKGAESFGMWIKDIEQKEPAEWWNENRNPFIDMDNQTAYWEDFVSRPIRNLLTRSKDFVITSTDGGTMNIELKDLDEDIE